MLNSMDFELVVHVKVAITALLGFDNELDWDDLFTMMGLFRKFKIVIFNKSLLAQVERCQLDGWSWHCP